MIWTQKVLNTDPITASTPCKRFLGILANPSLEWLTEHQIHAYRGRGITGPVLSLNSDRITIQALESKIKCSVESAGPFITSGKKSTVFSSCGNLHRDNFQKNYFRQAYAKPFSEATQIVAEEHSGQIPGMSEKRLNLDSGTNQIH